MAEPIKMQFGMVRWVGPGNHVLDGDIDATTVRGTIGVSGQLKSIGFGGFGKRVSCVGGPIFTTSTSYDVFLRKEFGGHNDCTCTNVFNGANLFNRD